MKFIDILTFLVPSDLFQIFFLLLLMASAIITIVLVHVNGTPLIWQERWENKNQKLTLDVEHGSVLEMSQAIATTPERVAGIMPSLLLVVGLLGTFIGIGIALNSASAILASVKSSSMDQTMTELMYMMQGLGTKFKTSTWGIIGYLGFKAWETMNNFEEKRLRWCIEKMNQQIHAQRQEKQERDTSLYFLIKESFEQLGQKIIADHPNTPSLSQQIQASFHQLEHRLLSQESEQNSLGELIQNAIDKQSLDLKEHISMTDDQFYQRYKIHFEIVKNKFTDVNDKLQETHQLIAERTRQIHQSLQLMTGIIKENQAEDTVLQASSVEMTLLKATQNLTKTTEEIKCLLSEITGQIPQFDHKLNMNFQKSLLISEGIQRDLYRFQQETNQHLTQFEQYSEGIGAQIVLAFGRIEQLICEIQQYVTGLQQQDIQFNQATEDSAISSLETVIIPKK